MSSGKVFRAVKRDRYGDPVEADGVTPLNVYDEDGNAFIGILDNIILGGQSASRPKSMQETADTSGMIGCRRDSSPRLLFGDRIVINGVRYEVSSVPEWDSQSFTGSDVGGTIPGGLYWVDVKAPVG